MHDAPFDILRQASILTQDEDENIILPPEAAGILLARTGTILLACDTIFFDGAGGQTRMYNVLRLLCHDIPSKIASQTVLALRDYQTGIGFDLEKEKTFPLCPTDRHAIALDTQAGTILLLADEDRSAVCIYVIAWDHAMPRANCTLRELRTFMQNWIMQRA